MRNYFIIIVLAMFALAFISVGCAEDSFAGKWKAQFDSQIGQQKYTFEFKVDGTNVTGHAIGERSMGTNDIEITEGKINGDEISFVEPLKLQDAPIVFWMLWLAILLRLAEPRSGAESLVA